MLKTKNIKVKWRSLLLLVTTAIAPIVGPAASTYAYESSSNIQNELLSGESPAKYGILNREASELDFVKIRVADDENAEFMTYAGDGEALQLEAGKSYEVRAYYHNDAMAETGKLTADEAFAFINMGILPEDYANRGECSGVGSVANTRFRIVLPQSLAAGQSNAQLGAQYSYDSIHWDEAANSYARDNAGELVATRDYVFDSLSLANPTEKDMKIVLDNASITLHNDNNTNGTTLSINDTNDNDVFPDSDLGGALISSNKELPGRICACTNYAGYISYTFHAEQSDAEVVKEASLDGVNFSESVEAKPGDVVTYRINYKNTGTRDLTKVTFRDNLPVGVTLVPGTTKLNRHDGQDELILADIIGQNGIETGTYAPGAEATITYQVKVDEDIYDKIDCTEMPLDNLITVTDEQNDSGITSTSRIVIKEECTPSTPTTFPNTGPVEIATVIIAIAALTAGAFYYYNSQKALNEAKRNTGAKGGKPDSK